MLLYNYLIKMLLFNYLIKMLLYNSLKGKGMFKSVNQLLISTPKSL